jgi:hypothetical protein
LPVALVLELERLPEPERGRVGADVDDHVEDRAARAAHQLDLTGLEVHAAQHAQPRPRVVVLDEVVVHAQLGQHGLAIRLQEEPARVAVGHGLDEQGSVQACLEAPHGPRA